jgi:putative intracellular protease/amidase
MMTTRTVHVAVFDGLADWEIGHLTAYLNQGNLRRDQDLRVVTVGAGLAPVTTMGGLRVVPDATLEDLRPDDSVLFVMPGGDGWVVGGLEAFTAKAVELVDAGVPVAAICGATFALAAAGVLDARAHTSNAPEFLAATNYAGSARYRPDLAVTDRNVVTASGIAPVEFAREALALIEAYDTSVLASWYKLYGQHDPAGYFELMEAAS